MDASCMEDTHVADQNRNQGSKQGDGSDGNFKSNPTDKEGMGGSGSEWEWRWDGRFGKWEQWR